MYDEMAATEALARANDEAIELTRAHCRHARIEMPYGNSPSEQPWAGRWV